MKLNEIETSSDEVNILHLQSLIQELDLQITSQKLQNIHSHAEAQEQHHENTHSHPSSTQLHHHENPRLEEQKRILSNKLNSVQNDLNNKQLQHQKYLNRIDTLTQILTIDLPKKEKGRQERALARESREKARLVDDPTLIQLSQNNRLLLQKAIAKSHMALEEKLQELIQKANHVGYQIYLARLETLLPALSYLNYYEKKALKQVIQLMHEYLITREAEQKERMAHSEAQHHKENLISDIQQTKHLLNRLKASNPELASQNLQMEEEDHRLEQTIEEQKKYRNTLVKTGLLGLFCTGVATGGAFFGMYLLLPATISLIAALFTPAAVLTIITLSLFIAALVYTIKNNTDNNQLNENKTIIENNQTTISRQNGLINSLEQEKLPSLQNEVIESERKINELDKRIENSHLHAELLLNNAKKVSVSSASNQAFFIEQSPNTPQFDTKPSTPPLNSLEEENAFSYN